MCYVVAQPPRLSNVARIHEAAPLEPACQRMGSAAVTKRSAGNTAAMWWNRRRRRADSSGPVQGMKIVCAR